MGEEGEESSSPVFSSDEPPEDEESGLMQERPRRQAGRKEESEVRRGGWKKQSVYFAAKTRFLDLVCSLPLGGESPVHPSRVRTKGALKKTTTNYTNNSSGSLARSKDDGRIETMKASEEAPL